MAKTTTVKTTSQKDSEIAVAIERCVMEINRLRQDMVDSQARIEQSRAETSAALDSARVVLDQLAPA